MCQSSWDSAASTQRTLRTWFNQAPVILAVSEYLIFESFLGTVGLAAEFASKVNPTLLPVTPSGVGTDVVFYLPLILKSWVCSSAWEQSHSTLGAVLGFLNLSPFPALFLPSYFRCKVTSCVMLLLS